MEVDGRLVDRPGISTPGEDATWRSLRERLVIALRPVGAPTSIGFFGLAAASLPFSGLQLGWVRPEHGHQVALIMMGFAAWATNLEDATGRTVLPLGRRGKGKVAVTGSLLEQTKDVITEPGVREQL